MIIASNVSLRFGKRSLFEDVNIKFTDGNCYGMIGANGAGKSTFLKILSGEVEPSTGEIIMNDNERLSVLKQNHFEYDEYKVLETVIMGNQKLYNIMKEKEAIYSKEEFTEADGIKAGELEEQFANMNGWEAEAEAAQLLNSLGVETVFHDKYMKDLEANQKVKILLAQALFGNPDVLLLDEPTNNLDIKAIRWLEDFLADFQNTVIVVSHDRHFLNKVCTHIVDIDFGKVQLYVGNYDFWYESSQLMLKQMKEANKKKEEKIKELQDFIARFSANASKSKQATSRKKLLEKIVLDDIKPSSRKYPYVDFKFEKDPGKEVLSVEGVSKEIDGKMVLNKINFTVRREDKIAVIGSDIAKNALYEILAGRMDIDRGKVTWGKTIKTSYFPKDINPEFETDEIIVDWLRKYSKDPDETYVRGFLGRMLFSGEKK